MADWKPKKSDNKRFYSWAMRRIQGESFKEPPPGVAENIDRAFWLWALVQIYGNKCFYCDASYDNYLQYRREHRNGDPNDWNPENIVLACNSCNVTKGNDSRQELGPSTGIQHREIFRGSKTEPKATIQGYSSSDQTKSLKARKDTPPIIKISEQYFRMARKYLYMNAEREGGFKFSDAILEICEYTGCKPEAAEDYIRISSTRISPFKITKPVKGSGGNYGKEDVHSDTELIVYNRNYDKKYTSDELRKMDEEILLELRREELEKKEEELAKRTAEEQAKLEAEKENLMKIETANKHAELHKQESFKAQARADQLKKMLETITGKPISEIEKELQSVPLNLDNGNGKEAEAKKGGGSS